MVICAIRKLGRVVASASPPGWERAIALLALGVTLAGIAFTIRPVRASTGVFLSVVALAAIACCLGVFGLRRKSGSKDGSGGALLAHECEQVAAALSTLLAEASPRRATARFGAGAGAGRREAEALAGYERDLRGWAAQVFDQAVAAGAILPAGRSMLQAESLFQLETLRNRFRDAAAALAG